MSLFPHHDFYLGALSQRSTSLALKLWLEWPFRSGLTHIHGRDNIIMGTSHWCLNPCLNHGRSKLRGIGYGQLVDARNWKQENWRKLSGLLIHCWQYTGHVWPPFSEEIIFYIPATNACFHLFPWCDDILMTHRGSHASCVTKTKSKIRPLWFNARAE